MLCVHCGLNGRYLEHRIVSNGLQALLNIACICVHALAIEGPGDHWHKDLLSICSLHHQCSVPECDADSLQVFEALVLVALSLSYALVHMRCYANALALQLLMDASYLHGTCIILPKAIAGHPSWYSFHSLRNVCERKPTD